MTLVSSVISELRPRRWLLPALLALAVVGCKDTSEPVAPVDTSYFPLQVGEFRVYEVVDTLWNTAVQPTQSRFQFRERVEEKYTDAAGRSVYRVVRARRNTPADAWRDDSVLVVSMSKTNVLVTRNNRRTVELVFPVRENYEWNLNAFNEVTQTLSNRKFVEVDKPFTATANGRTYSYPVTATAFDESIEKQCYPYSRRQVYAKDQGLVYRQFRRFSFSDPVKGTCEKIVSGRSRTEVLIESGR